MYDNRYRRKRSNLLYSDIGMLDGAEPDDARMPHDSYKVHRYNTSLEYRNMIKSNIYNYIDNVGGATAPEISAGISINDIDLVNRALSSLVSDKRIMISDNMKIYSDYGIILSTVYSVVKPSNSLVENIGSLSISHTTQSINHYNNLSDSGNSSTRLADRLKANREEAERKRKELEEKAKQELEDKKNKEKRFPNLIWK